MSSHRLRHIILSLAAAAHLTACGDSLDSDTVSSDGGTGTVTYGTILSSRPVTISDTDSNSDNILGGLLGGIAGGIAGSSVGSGRGNDVAAVVGAGAGMVVGSAIEGELGKSSGIEYIVQPDIRRPPPLPAATFLNNDDHVFTYEERLNQERLRRSYYEYEDENKIISVVQGDDTRLPDGTRVAIIEGSGHTRIVPARGIPPRY